MSTERYSEVLLLQVPASPSSTSPLFPFLNDPIQLRQLYVVSDPKPRSPSIFFFISIFPRRACPFSPRYRSPRAFVPWTFCAFAVSQLDLQESESRQAVPLPLFSDFFLFASPRWPKQRGMPQNFFFIPRPPQFQIPSVTVPCQFSVGLSQDALSTCSPLQFRQPPFTSTRSPSIAKNLDEFSP